MFFTITLLTLWKPIFPQPQLNFDSTSTKPHLNLNLNLDVNLNSTSASNQLSPQYQAQLNLNPNLIYSLAELVLSQPDKNHNPDNKTTKIVGR